MSENKQLENQNTQEPNPQQEKKFENLTPTGATITSLETGKITTILVQVKDRNFNPTLAQTSLQVETLIQTTIPTEEVSVPNEIMPTAPKSGELVTATESLQKLFQQVIAYVKNNPKRATLIGLAIVASTQIIPLTSDRIEPISTQYMSQNGKKILKVRGLIVHNTMMEGDNNLKAPSSTLAKRMMDGVNGTKKRTGDAHYLIGKTEPAITIGSILKIGTTTPTYQIMGRDKKAEGTRDFARIKGQKTADSTTLQAEIDHNDIESEAGKYSRKVSPQQIEALAKIIVLNNFSPNQVYSHASVQAFDHFDVRWMGLDLLEKDHKKDGLVTPELVKLVSDVQKHLLQRPKRSQTLERQWGGDSRIVASQIILNNLKNAQWVILKNPNRANIKLSRVDQAIRQNKAQFAKMTKQPIK